MSYYSTNYYGEETSNNLINQKPTLLAPISFIKNKFDEENIKEISNTKKSNSELSNNLTTSSPFNNVEEVNSNKEDSITIKSLSNNMINQSLDEKNFSNKNILNLPNESDSNDFHFESSKTIQHTNENLLTKNTEKINLKNTFNHKNNPFTYTDEHEIQSNEFHRQLKNIESKKSYENIPNIFLKNYNKISDSDFSLFPSNNSNWFGINIEKSDVSNLFFNDSEFDSDSNSLTSTQVPISANKFKYIAHTNLNCLCLQPKYNKDFKKFQPSYVMQVIKNLDCKNFYELKFWSSKFDYNHFKAQGAANNTTYNLRISATLFLNDISTSLCEFLENPKNWPLTSNNTFLKFSYSPLFQILIPEGTPNEIIFTGSTKSPILSDFKFNFYNYIPSFDDTKFNSLNEAKEATLVFIAEALDPNNPAGLCLLDNIYFS